MSPRFAALLAAAMIAPLGYAIGFSNGKKEAFHQVSMVQLGLSKGCEEELAELWQIEAEIENIRNGDSDLTDR